MSFISCESQVRSLPPVYGNLLEALGGIAGVEPRLVSSPEVTFARYRSSKVPSSAPFGVALMVFMKLWVYTLIHGKIATANIH